MASGLEQPEVPGFSFPGDLQELQDLLDEAGISNKSIHNLPSKWFLSASKVTQKQFLAFHIVYPEMLPPEKLVKDHLHLYDLDLSWEAAKVILGGFDDFGKYLDLLENRISINGISRNHPLFPPSLKTMKDLHELCMQGQDSTERAAPTVAKTSGRKSTRLAMKDLLSGATGRREDPAIPLGDYPDEKGEVEREATVNSALVVFLREFSSVVHNRETEFVFDPLVEKATFSNGNHFTAITDGVLRRLDDKQILAILEVKKRDREKNKELILMQEAAEITCWVKNSYQKTSFLNGHPLLISQDREELFVSFAFCDDEYIDYLRTASVENPARRYATIQTYGPFKITSRTEMLWFATLVVTITLAAQNRIPSTI
ncbi:hypothetical protein DTO282E5_6101 [Paecilomyces variotii]|nr:hypothetical protein DTO282E5_6101 [Paecilomyces variotii]